MATKRHEKEAGFSLTLAPTKGKREKGREAGSLLYPAGRRALMKCLREAMSRYARAQSLAPTDVANGGAWGEIGKLKG
jgi:hypothetical protein